MSGYRFQVQHVKGTGNAPADCLLRWEGQVETASEEELQEGRQFLHSLAPHAVWSDQVPHILVSRANLIKAEKGDMDLSRTREILLMDPPLHPSDLKGEAPMVQVMVKMAPQMRLDKDLLFVDRNFNLDRITGQKTKLVLPREYYLLAFKACHSLVASGHFGVKPMLARMKSRFWFPGILDYVRKQVALCGEGRCVLRGRGVPSKD